MTLPLALALVFGGYAAVMLAAAALVARQPRPALLPDDALPEAVVIVAARDEEAAIGRCLDALRAQDYPADKLTVLVANDHSTDGTAAIVDRVAAASGGPPVRQIAVGEPLGHVFGKALALHTAIEASTAPVLLITDADCAPVASWARTLASDLAEPTAGIACGMTRIAPRPGRFFDRVQQADWDLLLGMMSAVAAADSPAAGMGNNMGLRREAYAETGGFPALPFSITEDFVLFQAVHATGRPISFRTDPRSIAWTLPADGVRETYQQRRRWARGGLAGDPWVWVVYAVVFAVHALLVAGLALAPGAGLAALATKAGADGLRLAALRRRLGDRLDPAPFAVAVVFMTGYLVTLPLVLALGGRIDWKGRRH